MTAFFRLCTESAGGSIIKDSVTRERSQPKWENCVIKGGGLQSAMWGVGKE